MIEQSLLIYFSMYIITILIGIVYRNSLLKMKITNVVWGFVLIIPPVALATFRFNVGTDYNSYIRLYNMLKGYNPVEFARIFVTDIMAQEPLWYLTNRAAFLLFDSEIGMFFLSSLIMIIFVVLGIRYFARHISFGYALFVFFMLHYNMSFNAVRTLIAASIIFYALRYILERNLFKYFVFILLATAFHRTALLAILFYLVIPVQNRTLGIMKRYSYYFLILLTPIVLALALRIARMIPIFDKYFYKYSVSSFGLGAGFLIYVLPFLTPILFLKNKISKIDNRYSVLVDAALFHLPLRYLGYFTEYGHRVEVYISMIYIVLIPLSIRSLRYLPSRVGLTLYYTGVLLFYYIYTYIILLGHETYPFYFISGF